MVTSPPNQARLLLTRSGRRDDPRTRALSSVRRVRQKKTAVPSERAHEPSRALRFLPALDPAARAGTSRTPITASALIVILQVWIPRQNSRVTAPED